MGNHLFANAKAFPLPEAENVFNTSSGISSTTNASIVYPGESGTVDGGQGNGQLDRLNLFSGDGNASNDDVVSSNEGVNKV